MPRAGQCYALRVEQMAEGNRKLGVYRTAAITKTQSVYPAAWRRYRRRVRLRALPPVLVRATLIIAFFNLFAGAVVLIVTVLVNGLNRVPFLCPRCGTDWKIFSTQHDVAKQCPHCKLRYGEDPQSEQAVA
jgi:hypothetical protein